MKKKILTTLLLITGILIAISCVDSKNKKSAETDTTLTDEAGDSTLYGVCGENTAMHTLELITTQGDTLTYLIDLDENSPVRGGLLAGDKLAVLGFRNADGENIATSVINLTTLLGKWASIDKQFEIMEDGTVNSAIKEETRPWTSWRVFNGRLVLNKDTFEVNTLGADSLYLENAHGIFTFKRQK